MANQTDFQLLEEGPRNASVRLTGAITEGDINLVSVVPLSLFQSNEQRQTLVGLRVDKIVFSLSAGLEALLSWNGGSPQLIAALGKSGEFGFWREGGLKPDRNRTGYDGSINLRTAGFVPGTTQSYTILLRLVKLYTT